MAIIRNILISMLSKLQGHQSLYQSSLINEQFTIQLSSMDSICSIKFVVSENIFLKHFSIGSFKFLLQW